MERAYVSWINRHKLLAYAQEAGWDPKSTEDYGHYIDAGDAEIAGEERIFPNVAMAKGWAQRNRHKDAYGCPRVSAQRETEYGWEDTRCWDFTDGEWHGPERLN